MFDGAVGGIRTHGPLPVKRFRIVLVMTTSIPLQIISINIILGLIMNLYKWEFSITAGTAATRSPKAA